MNLWNPGWPAYDFYDSYSWTLPQQPPWGQNKVAILELVLVERFKKESIYVLFNHQGKKGGHYEEVAPSGGSPVVA